MLLSVSFLAFRHPPAGLEALPRWIRPAKRRGVRNRGNERHVSPPSPVTENGGIRGPEVKIHTEELSEAEITPKAKASEASVAVPTFSPNEDPGPQEKQLVSPKSERTASSHLAASSAQRSSSMPPPPKPTATATQKISARLMAPPPRPTSVPPPSSSSALRVPSTGPLPNRGLPANSQQRVSGGLTPNGMVSTPNLRGKVLLSPGHSPMDWAALTRKGNLSGVSTFQRVTPNMLKSMTGRKGKPAWSSWQGKVYNITPYLPFHPGGEPEIMKAAGRDGTKLFMDVHPWVNWENMLGSCLVGVMVPENYGMGEGGGSSLEDMD